MFGLATQLWNQNPIIFMMVVGLVLFGIYAAIAPLHDGDDDETYAAENVEDA